jgi:anthranilate phosphoribosyltransferase
MIPSVPWPRLLDLLLERRDLEPQQASALMNGWLSGAIEPVLTGALLAALRAKGVSGSELAAMAVVLREASPVPAARPALPLVDT